MGHKYRVTSPIIVEVVDDEDIPFPPLVLPPIPELAMWTEKVTQHAAKRAADFDSSNPDICLANAYWDGIAVWQTISERFFALSPVVDKAVKAYRDSYVFPARPTPGSTPGRWTYGPGLLKHYQMTHDEKSKEALILLAQSAAFCREGANVDGIDLRDAGLSLETILCAREVGFEPGPQLERLQSAIETGLMAAIQPGGHVKPFYAAVGARALIRLAPDEHMDLLNAVADTLSELWVPEREAMRYQNKVTEAESDINPAPDLNAMICPLYAFLWNMSQSPKRLEQADALFAGGVKYSWWAGQKQFNQQFWWIEDYFKWRG